MESSGVSIFSTRCLGSVPISDAQNAKRVGLYTFCKTCRALRVHVYESDKTFYNTLWFCILTLLKSLQNVRKSPQITPEVPKIMHLGHIFSLGLAKTVFLHCPPPRYYPSLSTPQTEGTPSILQMAFRLLLFVSKVKKTYQWSQLG